MIKVLFVAHSGTLIGGANRALLSLMCLLREKYSITPSLLIPEGDTSILPECERLAIPVYTGRYHSCCTVFQREIRDVLRMMKLLAAPLLDRLEARKISRKLPDDFDLIYTNDRMVIIGGYLAKLRRLPHVWHVRTLASEIKSIYPPFWGRLMNTHADRVVGISNAVITSLKSDISSEKLRLIHNGLETDRYIQLPKQPHDAFSLLLTAHIVPLKGQLEAVKALALLVNRDHMDAHLYFAGVVPSYGSPKYAKAIRSCIQENALASRVHFLGQVADMNELRSRMDCELECCWGEAFGRVTVEAMLSGLPVIGSRAGGTLDIVEDGISGLLYDLHSPESLAQKILWVHDHPAEVSEMTLCAKQRAMELFTLERSVQNVHALISDMVVEKKDAEKVAH